MSALKAFNKQPREWGPLLIYVICIKLDVNTLSQWESKSPKNEITKVNDLIQFFNARSQTLEAIESSKILVNGVHSTSEKKSVNRNNKNNATFTSLIATSDINSCDNKCGNKW